MNWYRLQIKWDYKKKFTVNGYIWYETLRYQSRWTCANFLSDPSKKLNSVAWVREGTIATERTPFVGEVSAKILLIEGAKWSVWRIPTAEFSIF
jgi:hypothetical protein